MCNMSNNLYNMQFSSHIFINSTIGADGGRKSQSISTSTTETGYRCCGSGSTPSGTRYCGTAAAAAQPRELARHRGAASRSRND